MESIVPNVCMDLVCIASYLKIDKIRLKGPSNDYVDVWTLLRFTGQEYKRFHV